MITAMHVNPTPAHVRPYLPSLYLPGGRGRYRRYPKHVEAIIPGTGYKTGRGVWGEQVLYLGGYGDNFKTHGGLYPYGHYSQVPLRGLGQVDQPWYTRPWVWAAAGGTVLALGGAAYMTLRPLRRNRRRRRSR
jgi:hypothetical protein